MTRDWGVSLEVTDELNEEGFSVTECVGGSMELDEGELGLSYQVGLLVALFFFCPFTHPPRFFSQVVLQSEIEFLTESWYSSLFHSHNALPKHHTLNTLFCCCWLIDIA